MEISGLFNVGNVLSYQNILKLVKKIWSTVKVVMDYYSCTCSDTRIIKNHPIKLKDLINESQGV